MSYITKLIARAAGRESHFFEGGVMTIGGEEPIGDSAHTVEPADPIKQAYVPVDEHYGDKLSVELDRLCGHEVRLMEEIARREKRLAEVRRSQRALSAGLAVLQNDMEASAS